MIPGVNIISRKVSIMSVNRAGGSRGVVNPSVGFFLGGFEALKSIYNHFHNILRLFDVLSNSPFTTSETMCNYYF